MASKPITRTPYSDQIGKDTVPYRSTGKVTYDNEPNIGLPQREGGLLPEVFRDKNFGSPTLKGDIKTPYKDAVK